MVSGIAPTDTAAVVSILPTMRIRTEFTQGHMRVLVDDRDVTGELRTPDISAAASIVSAIPAVREWLLPIQREVGAAGAVVAEGRDIGTKIFPDADVKFFLEADVDVRAARRHRELIAAGHGTHLEQIRRDLSGRDARDQARALAPLVPAPDAVRIDTSKLDPDQVVDEMMAVIAAKL
jgi:cytidylate kinase